MKCDFDADRMFTELWVIVLHETNEKMITRKETICTKQLKEYWSAELGRKDSFHEKNIHNKIDTILKKDKQFYDIYKKGEMRNGLDDELKLDLKAAVAVQPNFKIFYENFRDHPSLGLGIVEDSASLVSTLVSNDDMEEVVESPMVLIDDKTVAVSSAEDDEHAPTVKREHKYKVAIPTGRVNSVKKEKSQLATFVALQKDHQQSQMQHEREMQNNRSPSKPNLKKTG